MEKISKIKIISLGETALNTIEKEIITHENISIITIKNDYKDLKINFQDTDVILIILNTYFENDKNFALEIIRNTEKNDIFTGIYDIGNGYTDLFDSKTNFIIKCKSSEDLKNGINGITKTLTAKGMVTLDLDDLKTVFLWGLQIHPENENFINIIAYIVEDSVK